MRILSLLAILYLSVLGLSAQTTGLMLSQKEMEKVISKPAEVDRLITKYQGQADSTTDLATKISCLQTIVLLEPHSKNSYCLLVKSYDRISSLLMSVGLEEDAMQIIHRTFQIWRLCEERDQVMFGTQLGKLGSFHLLSGNKDSALYYFRLSLGATEVIPDPVWHAAAQNNMGIVWDSIGNRDSSYAYYNAAIFGLNADDPFHRHLLGSVTDNLANWYLQEKDAHVALQLFDDNIERYLAFEDTSHLVKSIIGQAKALRALGEFNRMLMVLDSAELYLSGTPLDNLHHLEQRLKVLDLKRKFWRDKGNLANELKVVDDLLQWQSQYDQVKSKTQKLMIGTLNRSEVARMYRELELRNRLAKCQKQSSKRFLWMAVLLGLSVITIVLLAFRLRRKR